jgi:hypothetical protein
MILSAQQLFSDGQVVTADAASTNYIDLGATGTPAYGAAALARDIGKGTPVEILVNNDEDATGTTPTCSVQIQVDDNTGFSSAKTVGVISFGEATAGELQSFRFLPVGTNERYLRLYYDVSGTDPSYTLTAGITMGIQTNV